MHCPKRLKHLLLYFYHKHKNRHLVRFPYSAQMSHCCEFEGMNGVGAYSFFWGKMGYGSAIGCNCHISADIGRFTSIGHGIKEIAETHAYKYPFATTSPRFYSLHQKYTFAREQMMDEYKYYDKERQRIFDVGNDCWIGNDACFIGGVKVCDGAVVLARAVVTKDVPPYAIVGGIPARIIGYRYDDDTIAFLLSIKWWEKPVEWLKDNWRLLCNIDSLKDYFRD